MDRSKAPRRSFLLHLALALVLGLALVGLTQCRTVADSVTGVDLTTGRLSGHSSCTHDCKHKYKQALKDENDRYKRAIHKCHSHSDCRKEANQEHKKNVDAIKEQQKACKSNCYNEGSGKGGD